MALTLPTVTDCPNCGTPVPTGGGAGFTAAEIDAIMALVPELQQWFQRARLKRAFAFVATIVPRPIPWTPARIASLAIPQSAIWLGGDNGLNTEQGLPIPALGVLTFGPEEGGSPTYVISGDGTVGAAQATIKCLELIP